MKLYEIADRYINLQDLLEDETIDKEVIDAALEGIKEGDLQEKLVTMCKFIKNIEGDNVSIANEIKRLQEKKKAKENSKDSIKEYIFEQMQRLGLNKYKTPLFNLGIQLSPPSINVLDEKKIPRKYFTKQLPVMDKRELLLDLKAGIKIRGCEITQKEGLRIR
jgi:hypothetical protein